MKKSVTIIFALTLLSNTFLFAQHWVDRFNGNTNSIDVTKAMVLDDAGNVYVTGYSTNGANDNDYVTIKYNTNGVQQWLARYNGPGNGGDVPNSIFVDQAGFIYVTGSSDALAGTFIDDDAATIKYSPQGDQLWVSRYDGGIQRGDAGNAVKVDATGNVYITGYTSVSHNHITRQDYLTVKYNSSGEQQWTDTYNGMGNSDDAAIALALDPSGNIYTTGTIFTGPDPIGEEDYFTIKYNPAGVRQWTAEYNGPISEPDIATAIAVDKSGNAYITGYSRGTDLDYATIKYSTDGIQQWVARYNGPANSSDIAYALAVDDEGNVYVTGGDQKTIYNEDYLTIKYNSSGVIKWTARYDGPSHDNDEAYAIAIDKSGNVYVTGSTNGFVYNSNIATIKYSSSGKQKWVKTYNGSKDSVDVGNAIAVDTLGNVYIAGTSTSKKTSVDFTTIKYPAPGALSNDKIQQEIKPQPFSLYSNYPNPFSQNTRIRFDIKSDSNESTKVKLIIFNMEGREVDVLVDASLKNGSYEVEWNAEHFPAGVYFYKLLYGESLDVRKMVLIRQ